MKTPEEILKKCISVYFDEEIKEIDPKNTERAIALIAMEEYADYKIAEHICKKIHEQPWIPMEDKSAKTSCVPYQLCPKCNGVGQIHVFDSNFTLSTFNNVCDVCHGAKIIPMHIVTYYPVINGG